MGAGDGVRAVTTTFTRRAGCKERDVWENCDAGQVKCNALLAALLVFVDQLTVLARPRNWEANVRNIIPTSVKLTHSFG